MRRFIRTAALGLIAAVAFAGGTALTSVAAQAQGIYIGAGPGWHGDAWRWRHHRRYLGAYGAADCRVVVRRFWRHGQRVVVRRRECF